MGYYADLINEKRNEKSERFMFMGKSYNITLKNFQQVKSQIVQDFKKEVHRLEIEMMKTIGQEHFEIKEELESFKDGFKESTLWQLDKVYDKLFFGSKDNSKEEKDNDKQNGLGSRHGNIVKEFKYKGCDIAILRAINRSGVYDGSSWYYSDIYKGNTRIPEDDTHASIQSAESYAKIAVDIYLRSHNNSKEEKDNADSAYIEASQKAERIINRMLQSRDKKEAKRFLEKIGWETRTLGEDPADYARAIRRAVRNYPEKSAEILSNEKEETKDKENASAEDSEKIKRQIVSVEAYLKDRLEWQKSVNKEVEGCQRELARLKKMLGNNNSKEEEKGYYAKLAEEKASRKN